MPAAPDLFAMFSKLATKWGPWTALAIALVALLAFRYDAKLDALTERLTHHMAAQDQSVRLLRIMCASMVSTEAEREMCRQ